MSVVSVVPDQNTIEEQEMDTDIGDNEVRVPSPSVEEIMREAVQNPAKEPAFTKATKVEEPEPPEVFLDGIVIGPREMDGEFDKDTMKQSTIPYWPSERMKARAPNSWLW